VPPGVWKKSDLLATALRLGVAEGLARMLGRVHLCHLWTQPPQGLAAPMRLEQAQALMRLDAQKKTPVVPRRQLPLARQPCGGLAAGAARVCLHRGCGRGLEVGPVSVLRWR
jgi:hypothetical protein